MNEKLKPPEGWKLVPVEPTREMWAAMANTLYGYDTRHHDKVAGDLYYAMLAAAPTLTPQGEETPAPTPAPQADVDAIAALREAEPYVEICHSLMTAKGTRENVWRVLKQVRAVIAATPAPFSY